VVVVVVVVATAVVVEVVGALRYICLMLLYKSQDCVSNYNDLSIIFDAKIFNACFMLFLSVFLQKNTLSYIAYFFKSLFLEHLKILN
jgi:hypothetical protein